MLKFSYVPATRATSSKAFFAFFAAASNSTNETSNAGGACHLISLSFLDVYGAILLRQGNTLLVAQIETKKFKTLTTSASSH
jgi:hypothetical protein